MLQREGRIANPEEELRVRRVQPRRKSVVVTNWEGRFLVVIVLAIIALGFVGGLNSVIAWFK